MTRIRFLEDVELRFSDGYEVLHRAGSVVEVDEEIACLYLTDGRAVPVEDVERALAPEGELR